MFAEWPATTSKFPNGGSYDFAYLRVALTIVRNFTSTGPDSRLSVKFSFQRLRSLLHSIVHLVRYRFDNRVDQARKEYDTF